MQDVQALTELVQMSHGCSLCVKREGTAVRLKGSEVTVVCSAVVNPGLPS